MFADQKGEIGILGVFCRVLIAVTVHGYDPVRILADHGAVRIHAERAHQILKLFRPVNNLALVQFVGQMAEHFGRQLHPYPDIDPVALCGDLHLPANSLHPLASAPPDRDHTAGSRKYSAVLKRHGIAFLRRGDILHRRTEVEIHLVLQFPVQIAKNNIIDIRPQMTHLGIQQMQTVLQAGFPDCGVRSGIELCSLPAVFQIDLIHIAHQLQGPGLTHMLMQASAEIIGNIVFSIGKSACAAEPAHD